MNRKVSLMVFIEFFFINRTRSLVFAGKMELTTYYPAPYGEYKNLNSTESSNFATTSGNVGVGTTSPQTKLDVRGGVKVGTENSECSESLAGTMRYQNGNLEFCSVVSNNYSWFTMGFAPVEFYAYYNGSPVWTATHDLWTTIPFNATVYDTHAAFNTTTHEYTIPFSGTYFISVQVRFIINSTVGMIMDIERTPVSGGPSLCLFRTGDKIDGDATNPVMVNRAVAVRLTQGDKVFARVLPTGTSPQLYSGDDSTYLIIQRLN